MKETGGAHVSNRGAMVAFAVKVLLLAAILPLSPLLKAQNSYGSIVGTVTDSSGAVLPDVSVAVINTGTGVQVKVQTNGSGQYSAVNLIPARYKVEIEKPGFKRFERANVDVLVGAVIRIDSTLAIGSAMEVVEVTTATPLLQTDTSSMSQEVEGDVVQQMPLNGRNVMNLIELAPGVVPAGAASGSTGMDQTTGRTAGGVGWNNYEIGGAIQGFSSNYVDGVPNSLYGDNITAVVPTQDAVQEFNVVSSNATADYGRFAGGVVNMTTKSGSNAFHGSAYEYFRNAIFNANTWFTKQSQLAKGQANTPTEWNQNQYGAAINGPIKRDKAFFMFTWENFKALTALSNSTFVPTQAMQNGVFTKQIQDPTYISSGGAAGCNVQPYTGQSVNGQTYPSGGYYIVNLYQGSCGDPLNKILKQYFPYPNASAANYNWFLNTPLSDTQIQYNARVDYQISPKQRLFGRYTYWTVYDGHQTTFNEQGSPAFGTTTPTTWTTSVAAPKYPTQQFVLGDSYTLNSSTVLDVRVNYIRQTATGAVQNPNVDETQFGQYYKALASQMTVPNMPVYALSGGDGLFSFANIANGNVFWYNTYSLDASLTRIVGRHSLKAGVEARLMDNSGTPYYAKAGGSYNYDNHYVGDEFAEFLMGYPSGNSAAQFQTFQITAGYSYYQGYYVMDDWQATRKLTLNLGLRYELPGGPSERNNKMSVLLPNKADPYTGITGTEALVASSLYSPRTFVVEKHDLFAPRAGFAYRASEKTVIKGGYGLAYLPDDVAGPNDDGLLPTIAPFVSAYTTFAAPDSNAAPTPLQTVLAQFATNGLIQPSYKPAASFMTTYASSSVYKGQTLQAPIPYQPYPYVQQWNLGVSHQFKGDFMAGVNYVGLHGTNLPGIGNPHAGTYYSVDQIPDQYLSMAPAALTATAATCANAPGLAGKITVGQCLRPNPYYADMQDTARYAAIQNYKSLQVNAEKRLGSHGLLMTNYTWSKNMSNTDSPNQQLETTSAPRQGAGDPALQDYNNPGGEYSLIGDDVKNRFVLDYEVNLPFGKGQKYVNSLSGVADALVSGWAVNGITIFQSGFPVFLQTATANLLTSTWGGGLLRPTVVPGCNKQVGGGNSDRALAGAWFNKSCFVYPFSSSDPTGQVTFGNEPRVDPELRADGIKDFDFAFQKSTPIHESLSWDFRAEFFNVFNRTQFAPPVNSLGASNFGAVVSQANRPRQIQVSARVNF